jgi:hypothetical protein
VTSNAIGSWLVGSDWDGAVRTTTPELDGPAPPSRTGSSLTARASSASAAGTALRSGLGPGALLPAAETAVAPLAIAVAIAIVIPRAHTERSVREAMPPPPSPVRASPDKLPPES